MIERNLLLLQLPATLGAGLIAGTFFCFSSFVMPALARLEPVQAVAAMQKINISVVNPLFMAVLFGTAILYAAQAFAAFRSGLDTVSMWWLLASILYVVCTIGITLFGNVPLNGKLADLASTSSETAEFWAQYVKDWTRWNSMRGFTATAACAASIYAISVSR
jgi:uncharacterized membrane protein